jgi:general secretion pathway protein J
MVAVAITALMGGLIVSAFNTGFHAKETVEAEAQQYRMLRTAMSRMDREIAAAFVSDRYDPKRYRDQNERPTNFIGEKNKLLFTSLAHQRMAEDAKESDQMVVEYSVKASPDRDAHGRHDLVRRENPVLGEHMDRGGAEDIVYENARGIEFSYWDADRKQWMDEWDTRRLERKSALPTRVKIVLLAKDENGKEVRYETQTRVMLNAEFQRY